LLQGNVIEQAPPGFHLDKHVQIAIRLLVTPGRGPEKPKVVGAVLSGEAQEVESLNLCRSVG